MIKILISNQQKVSVEHIYWSWISKYHLKGLKSIIINDSVLKSLIVKNNDSIEIALKKFLLSDYNALLRLKNEIDNMRDKHEDLKESTKQYLKMRYINYRSSQAAKIVNILGITVCPYCNQNHINIVYRKDQTKYWGDLDHFYDKENYPELTICLYNMIPVCKTCNQLKSFHKTGIISPYNPEKKSNIRFKTEFDEKLDLDYLQGKSCNFNIVIDKKTLLKEDEEEIRLFDLQNRYANLKQNAIEIIVKAKAYDSLYKKQLKENFGLSDDKLNSYIFGYDENHLNRVLSKFNFDLMNEFINHDD